MALTEGEKANVVKATEFFTETFETVRNMKEFRKVHETAYLDLADVAAKLAVAAMNKEAVEPLPVQSTLTPTTLTFVEGAATDSEFTITWGTDGESLSSVKNGDTALVATTDYTYSDGTLTILGDYLNTLTEGTETITVQGDTDGDGAMEIAITITADAAE